MVWAAVGISAVSATASIFGGIAAGDKAKSAAKHQAKLTFAQRQEEIRQKKAQGAYQRGTAVAAVGASNLQMSGSSSRFIAALDTENMREIAFAQDAARREKRAIKKGASGAGASLFANAGAQLGALAGTLAGHFLTPTAPAATTTTTGGSGFITPGSFGA